MTRPIPQQAIAFISEHEGRRLQPYRDQAGFPTIGVGHLLSKDVTIPLTRFKPITNEECDRLLAEDLADKAKAVDEAVAAELSDSQFTACLSLAFNIGADAFRRSTVVKRIMAGDMEGAAKAFMLWNKVRDPKTGKLVESAGLTRRRAAEADLFRAGV